MKKKNILILLILVLAVIVVIGGLFRMNRGSADTEVLQETKVVKVADTDTSITASKERAQDLESNPTERKDQETEEAVITDTTSGEETAEEKTSEATAATESGTEEAAVEVATSEEERPEESETEETASEEAADEEAATENTAVSERKGRIAIDPGHQGSWVDMSGQEPIAPGSAETKRMATGGTTGRFSGVPEYQLALDISLKLRDRLESLGYEVILTREDNDTAISNSERAQLANNAGADFSIRIHADGAEDASVSGASALIPGSDNPYVGNRAAESEALASCVLNAYCESTGMINRGITYHNDMTGINWSTIPVMILEMGFMTNQSDDWNMQDEAFQEQMVSGIVAGIEQYYEIYPSTAEN